MFSQVSSSQCGNLQIFPPTIFCKNSVKLYYCTIISRDALKLPITRESFLHPKGRITFEIFLSFMNTGFMYLHIEYSRKVLEANVALKLFLFFIVMNCSGMNSQIMFFSKYPATNFTFESFIFLTILGFIDRLNIFRPNQYGSLS